MSPSPWQVAEDGSDSSVLWIVLHSPQRQYGSRSQANEEDYGVVASLVSLMGSIPRGVTADHAAYGEVIGDSRFGVRGAIITAAHGRGRLSGASAPKTGWGEPGLAGIARQKCTGVVQKASDDFKYGTPGSWARAFGKGRISAPAANSSSPQMHEGGNRRHYALGRIQWNVTRLKDALSCGRYIGLLDAILYSDKAILSWHRNHFSKLRIKVVPQ